MKIIYKNGQIQYFTKQAQITFGNDSLFVNSVNYGAIEINIQEIKEIIYSA